MASDFENKVAHIRRFVSNNRNKKIIIFCETKREAQMFDRYDWANFIPIHGDLEQRQRESALSKFKMGGANYILVGTDVAARGLDVDDIDVVIQVSCK